MTTLFGNLETGALEGLGKELKLCIVRLGGG